MAEEERRLEICIVGGGLTGLATAYYLQQQPALRRANIRLIEAQQQLGGQYVSTAYASADVLHALLKAPAGAPSAVSSRGCPGTAAIGGLPGDELQTLANEALHSRLLLKHKSVPAAALLHRPTSSSNGQAEAQLEKRGFDHGGSDICMEFGAGTPHLLAPGGGHVLRLTQQLLMPSQLLVGRKQAASLFSLMRSRKKPGNLLSRLQWLGKKSPQAPATAHACKPGLSRLTIAQAVIAAVREICRRRSALKPTTQLSAGSNSALQTATAHEAKDMSVSSFAELHSSKALAATLLLPAFSACSYAGDAGILSTASYFPRAWLLHQNYGSLLRGAWAERRAAKRRSQEAKKSGACGFVDDRRRILPVLGCKAFPPGHDVGKSVAAEGAGVFSPIGGMRQLVKALEQHIQAPPADKRPVSVVRGSRVVEIASQTAGGTSCIDGRAAEVVCHDGARYPADLVICAVHPYDLAAILGNCAKSKSIFCTPSSKLDKGEEQNTGEGKSSKTNSASLSTMASILLAVPCASWVTVHAFGKHSVRHANSLGRGCLYAPHQLEPLKQALAQSQQPLTMKDQPSDVSHGDAAKAIAALSEAIRVAQDSMMVAELQLPGNLFPHSHAAALSAAGLFDSAAAPWVTSAPLLHAQAAVRVHHLESLVEKMQQLLLPLQQLLQSEGPFGEQYADEENQAAAGVRALGLLIAVAEDAVVRTLMRERITSKPDKLLLCSRLALQAEPQWPLNLQPTAALHDAKLRQKLFSLLQQYESLLEDHRSSSPAVLAACGQVSRSKEKFPVQPPDDRLSEFGSLVESNETESLPRLFANGRMLFHHLRIQNFPWFHAVGPSGSLSPRQCSLFSVFCHIASGVQAPELRTQLSWQSRSLNSESASMKVFARLKYNSDGVFSIAVAPRQDLVLCGEDFVATVWWNALQVRLFPNCHTGIPPCIHLKAEWWVAGAIFIGRVTHTDCGTPVNAMAIQTAKDDCRGCADSNLLALHPSFPKLLPQLLAVAARRALAKPLEVL
ncbi:hypothetical protein Efla_000203 [Eimeria flavescens]